MQENKLEKLYKSWSNKNDNERLSDRLGAVRKCDAVTEIIQPEVQNALSTVLDLGCGYGDFLIEFCNRNPKVKGVGFDFSDNAISTALENNTNSRVSFQRLENLSLKELIEKIDAVYPTGIDAVFLVDLLEHVPDCLSLVRALSNKVKFFIIKLPVESSIFDNYFLPKERLGPNHSNGHLREFDVNGVFSFVSKLGLIPLSEKLYVYHVDDMVPVVPAGSSVYRKVVSICLRLFKNFTKRLLPTRIFMRLVGGGGYVCVATFDEKMILTP